VVVLRLYDTVLTRLQPTTEPNKQTKTPPSHYSHSHTFIGRRHWPVGGARRQHRSKLAENAENSENVWRAQSADARQQSGAARGARQRCGAAGAVARRASRRRYVCQKLATGCAIDNNIDNIIDNIIVNNNNNNNNEEEGLIVGSTMVFY
jgi:hypothetical protein